MAGLRRKRHAPARVHPDPRVEVELEHIRALRRMAVVKESSVAATLHHAATCRDNARSSARNGYPAQAKDLMQQAASADGRAAKLEAEVRAAQDEVARLIEPLSDSDLSYL